MTTIYLGTPAPSWLWRGGHGVMPPLFVSRRRLAYYPTWKPALTRWAMDSGGFTELSQHGRWTISAPHYAGEIMRATQEIGQLDWAAPMDWMCEPWITQKTGLSVREHQERTIDSVHELRAWVTGTNVIPALQGWSIPEYLAHVEMYDKAGLDLRAEPVVGLGSVCRRQGMGTAEALVRRLHAIGIRLHGFGFKTTGLERVGGLLHSADSQAWSLAARRRKIRLPECTHKAAVCTWCPRWARRWYRGLDVATHPQRDLMSWIATQEAAA